MDASKNPEYLRGTADAVATFKAALEHFLELHVDTTEAGIGRGMMPAVMPKNGADAGEIAQRRSAVARAAGRAANAPSLTGSYMAVQGVSGAVDPIANWNSILRPKPLLEAKDVRDLCDQMIGRLGALAAEAEAAAPPTIGVEVMHPVIWAAAKRLWRDGHFQEAVAKAAEALMAHLQQTVERTDTSGTKLWQEVFSKDLPVLDRPRLRWAGRQTDEHVKRMNEGLRLYAPGVQMLIRNPAAHAADTPPKQEALEQLATLSLLARWVDRCEIQKAS